MEMIEKWATDGGLRAILMHISAFLLLATVLCLCALMLLHWSTPTHASSGAHIVQTHSHPNEPTTYQAQLPGDPFYYSGNTNALPAAVQTTKAVVQRLAPDFQVGVFKSH